MSKISVLSFGTCLRKAHYESLVQAYRILALNNSWTPYQDPINTPPVVGVGVGVGVGAGGVFGDG